MKYVETGYGKIPYISLLAILSISLVVNLPGLAISPIMGKLNQVFKDVTELEIQLLTVLPNLVTIPFILCSGKICTPKNQMMILGIHDTADPSQLSARRGMRTCDPSRRQSYFPAFRRQGTNPSARNEIKPFQFLGHFRHSFRWLDGCDKLASRFYRLYAADYSACSYSVYDGFLYRLPQKTSAQPSV